MGCNTHCKENTECLLCSVTLHFLLPLARHWLCMICSSIRVFWNSIKEKKQHFDQALKKKKNVFIISTNIRNVWHYFKLLTSLICSVLDQNSLVYLQCCQSCLVLIWLELSFHYSFYAIYVVHRKQALGKTQDRPHGRPHPFSTSSF